MQQMGYVIGTGLGRHAEGRVEPVQAVILPAGKSLGNFNIFSYKITINQPEITKNNYRLI